MFKTFNPAAIMTDAVAVSAPSDAYFFAENGDPGKRILCHRNQGAELFVNGDGMMVLSVGAEIPSKNSRIRIVRESNDPKNQGYTRARQWFLETDWDEAKWALQMGTTFRAMGFNHRNSGKFQGNTKKEVLLATGTLRQILDEHPRNPQDQLAENVSTTVKKLGVLSYETYWERLDKDGKWVECADPRPKQW